MFETLLFKTIHGSRLYNLNNEDSDYDYFEVYFEKGRSRQKVKDGLDLTKTSYSRFLMYAEKGVPQYLEAMFSQKATVNHIDFITEHWMPNMANTRPVYVRTIHNFWDAGDFKRKRHAIRLSLNLRSLMEDGRFNPTLTDEQIDLCNTLAQREDLPALY